MERSFPPPILQPGEEREERVTSPAIIYVLVRSIIKRKELDFGKDRLYYCRRHTGHSRIILDFDQRCTSLLSTSCPVDGESSSLEAVRGKSLVESPPTSGQGSFLSEPMLGPYLFLSEREDLT
jgi:hypothetical protein